MMKYASGARVRKTAADSSLSLYIYSENCACNIIQRTTYTLQYLYLDGVGESCDARVNGRVSWLRKSINYNETQLRTS